MNSRVPGLTNHNSSVPVGSGQAEKEAGGFAEKGITNVGGPIGAPRVCVLGSIHTSSCLFVSLLALRNLFHRLHRFHVISRELSFEAKPMKADIPNTRVIKRVISSRAGSGTPRSARTRSQRSPVHAKP